MRPVARTWRRALPPWGCEMKRFLWITPALALTLGNCLVWSLPVRAESDVTQVGREVFSQPLPSLNEAERVAFFRGRGLFRQAWVVAPARDSEVDGLGPLYNRLSCGACHPKNGRGKAPDTPAERMQSMLVRLSVPGVGPHGGVVPHPVYGDQLNEEGVPGVPGEGRAVLLWRSKTVQLAGGERVSLRFPLLRFKELAYGDIAPVLTSPRVGQPVYGLGFLEAVPDAALEALEQEAKADGVKGHVNRVWDVVAQRTVVGRFGWKANMPNLTQQTAGAMLGDLGITSPLFPEENCTPTQNACRQAPSGGHPELSAAQLADVVSYLTHLDVPARRDPKDPKVMQGEAAFARLGCALCHRPSLPLPEGGGPGGAQAAAIAPYTDLLVHDMGADLADGRPDFTASGREWRTPPLWGIGLTALVLEGESYLHDGRARTLQEAILWHGGEARVARERYASLPRGERDALLAFLRSL